MILKQSVITFCTECLYKNKDSKEKIGILIGHPISPTAFLCTIMFRECGHKRVAILNPEQISKMTEAYNVTQTEALQKLEKIG